MAVQFWYSRMVNSIDADVANRPVRELLFHQCPMVTDDARRSHFTMTLDDRIAKERKAIAFHQRAIERGRMPARKLVRHGRERRTALAILAVLEKVKQLPGM